jgi:predicted regulator of amino acid metabolism with ACT domain
MWKQIAAVLERYPARLKVARALVELGLRVGKDGKIFCGMIEIVDSKLARALGVDRRVIKETTEAILKNERLASIFTNLRPAGPFLGDVARFLGYRVVEIHADPTKVGILASAASLIAKEGISIRQAVADDPELTPEPKLILVIEKQPSGATLESILKIPGVIKLTTY